MMGESPALLVIFAGQSNMLGHAKAVGGRKPLNPDVHAWNNLGKAGEGAWGVARLGARPFNRAEGEPNSPALHFADRLQRRTGRPVLMIGRPVNGATLQDWATEDAPHMARLLLEVGHALASRDLPAPAPPKAECLLWHQGESDDPGAWMVKEPRLTSLPDYAAAFHQMAQLLRRQSWWGPETKLIAGELVQDGWLAARNDFYGDPEQWRAIRSMAVAPSQGLADVGDRAHFGGAALQELGGRMFREWKRLDAAGAKPILGQRPIGEKSTPG